MVIFVEAVIIYRFYCILVAYLVLVKEIGRVYEDWNVASRQFLAGGHDVAKGDEGILVRYEVNDVHNAMVVGEISGSFV